MNNVQRVNQETANTSNLNEKFEVRITKSQLKEVIDNLITSLDIETFAVIVSTFFKLYENKCETITLQKESDITSLKEYICNVAIPTFEDAILKTGDAEYICTFASNIKGANISRLESAIINTGDARCIYFFANDVNDANISRLEDAIINTGNAKDIYDFARDVEGANISRLEDAIIETGNARYIYGFALYIKCANISRLEDAIIETGDTVCIFDFARDIEGANISKLMNYLKDTVLKTMKTGSTEDISDLSCCLSHQIAEEIKVYYLFN